jgi:RNA polymerase sigma-70 factor (ECF subfamily)
MDPIAPEQNGVENDVENAEKAGKNQGRALRTTVPGNSAQEPSGHAEAPDQDPGRPKSKAFYFESADFYDAFASLYPTLTSFARRYGATYPEDIVQEAFVILMQRNPPVDHPVAFLYGTVRTLSLTEKRPMKNQNLSLDALILDPGMASDAEERMLHQEVRGRMRTLPPIFREALWLFVVEGLSIKEIAEVIDIPEATVKTRIFRAKAQLREHLNPNGGIHVMA